MSRTRTVDETRYSLKIPAFPEYVDEIGHIKAGYVMRLIDVAGSISANRHVGPDNFVVTASLDRTNFLTPVLPWEVIVLESRMTQVWNSSMECQVKVSVFHLITEETREVATAYLVFVGFDARRNKIKDLPKLELRTAEERQLAQAADLRKQNRMKEGKELPILPIELDADRPIIIERTMVPTDANSLNNVFGGVILDIIHEAGQYAAKRQALLTEDMAQKALAGTVVGVRQDRMSFLEPAFIGEVVQAAAIITKTWRSSMEVQVEVQARNPHTGQVRKIADSYLVYVRVGADGQPAQVPPWIPQTEVQQRRADNADLRRDTRLEEEQQAAVL